MSIMEQYYSKQNTQQDFANKYRVFLSKSSNPEINLVDAYATLMTHIQDVYKNTKPSPLLLTETVFEKSTVCWLHEDTVREKNIVLYEDTDQEKAIVLHEYTAQEKIIVLPEHRQYIIILGFLLKFDAGQVNDLLLCAGMQTLSGRVLLDSIFIAGLNNKWDYDICTFKLYPKYTQRPTSVCSPIDSFEALCTYVDSNGMDLCLDSITDEMTDNIALIKTAAELDTYIAGNTYEFLHYRESPRRFLCQQLREFLDEQHQIVPAISFDFAEEISNVWSDFLTFYEEAINYKLSDYIANKKVERKIDSNRLMEYINGTRRLTYKVFVLLIVYFDAVNFTSYDHDDFNDKCIKAGFPPLFRAHPSAFDTAVGSLVDAMANGLEVGNYTTVQQYFHHKIEEHLLLDLYINYTDLQKRINLLKKNIHIPDNFATTVYAELMTLSTIKDHGANTFEHLCKSNQIYEQLELELVPYAKKKKGIKKAVHLIENPLYLRMQHDM